MSQPAMTGHRHRARGDRALARFRFGRAWMGSCSVRIANCRATICGNFEDRRPSSGHAQYAVTTRMQPIYHRTWGLEGARDAVSDINVGFHIDVDTTEQAEQGSTCDNPRVSSRFEGLVCDAQARIPEYQRIHDKNPHCTTVSGGTYPKPVLSVQLLGRQACLASLDHLGLGVP